MPFPTPLILPELLRLSDCGLSQMREGPRAPGEDGLEGKTQQQTNEALNAVDARRAKGIPVGHPFSLQ